MCFLPNRIDIYHQSTLSLSSKPRVEHTGAAIQTDVRGRQHHKRQKSSTLECVYHHTLKIPPTVRSFFQTVDHQN